MGDLLQTSPLITYLKQREPDSQIGLLAADGFEEVMRSIPDIDIHHPLQLFKYMLPLKNNDLLANLNIFKKLLQELQKYHYDLIFNLTHNRLGSILSALLHGEVVGLTIDAKGVSSVKNPWMRQFYNTNINRGLNQFNLVDLYKLSAGYKKEHFTPDNTRIRFNISPDAQKWADAQLQKSGLQPGKRIIGIQTGASSSAKRWKPEYFNALAKNLSPDYFLLFFGTAQEKDLTAQAAHDIPDAIDFTGKTSVSQLAALLKKCSLLLTNDTGTQHLSAAVGTPIISLTLGPALASETGPYGEGHLIVEPDIDCVPCSYKYSCTNLKCHELITPELVEWLVRKTVENGGFDHIDELFGSKVKISRTCFDEQGLWDLYPIAPGSDKKRRQVNIAYRKTWLSIYNSNDNNTIETQPDNGKDIAFNDDSLLTQLNELIELGGEGEVSAKKLCSLAQTDPINLDAIKNLGAEIALTDQRIEIIGRQTPSLRPLTLDFHLRKEALPDTGLKQLSEMTAELYFDLKNASVLLKKYLMEKGDSKPDRIESPALSITHAPSKILAVNAPYFASGEIIRAMKCKGLEVLMIELTQEDRQDPESQENFIHRFLRTAMETKPDFIFTVNHLGFDSQGFLTEEFAKLGIPTAIYYVDSPLLVMDNPQNLNSEFTHIFSWDKYYIERLRQFDFANLHYLPLATDEINFHPRDKSLIPSQFLKTIVYAADSLNEAIAKHQASLDEYMLNDQIARKYESQTLKNGKPPPDILENIASDFNFDSPGQKRSFLTYWTLKLHQTGRLKILKSLAGYGLTIMGDEGWKEHFAPGQARLEGSVRYFDQLPLLYSGSDICFNCTSLQMPQAVNQRVFDIPACGGFLLTDYRQALEEIFHIEHDIAVYHSPDEAAGLAQYYLKNPQLREKMSQRARAKILKDHTYLNRIDTIIEIMSNSRPMKFNSDINETIVIHNGEPHTEPVFTELTPDLEQLKSDFTGKIDVPQEISIHHLGNRSLIIAPQRAAWIVTDPPGAFTIQQMSNGAAMGQAAADTALKFHLDAENALRKLREVVEKMNRNHFRQSAELKHIDIDKNPRSLQLFLTRKCNLRCNHCYFDAGQAMSKELPAEKWKDIIRKFAFMGQRSVVTFTGGEPLMHPQFLEIAQEAADQGLTVYLLTNGGLVKDRETARQLAKVIDVAQISLEGTAPEINDSIRGKGSFQGAVNAIRLFLAEKVEVEMTTVVLPQNVDDLRANLSDFIASFASNRLRCALSVANPKGRMDDANQDTTQSLVGRVLSGHGDAPWLRTGFFQPGYTNFGCELATAVVVNPEGKIGNCPYLNYSGPRNVLHGDFAQLTVEDRAWHRQAIISSKKCATCDLRNFQCGGCKIFGNCGEQIKLRNYYRMMEEK